MDCTAIAAACGSPSPASPKAPLENWSAIVTELMEQHGVNQRQIAAFCGCGQPAISDLARGATKDPLHRVGERLRELLKAKRDAAAHEGAAPAAPARSAGEADGTA